MRLRCPICNELWQACKGEVTETYPPIGTRGEDDANARVRSDTDGQAGERDDHDDAAVG